MDNRIKRYSAEKGREKAQTDYNVGRQKITMRLRGGEKEFRSEPANGYSEQKAISSHTAGEKPDTPPQPRVTAPLILLTLLVFHPHRPTGSIHTSITLQSFSFPPPYVKGVGSRNGFRMAG